MPDALRVACEPPDDGASSCERSRPRDGLPAFLTAVFAPAPFGFEGCEASSSARRASFSAFLRAASAALSAAASLEIGC